MPGERDYAQIQVAIWGHDKEWRKLDSQQQRLYFLLLSQPELNYAGVVPLTPKRWARFATDTTVTDIQTALKGLEQAGFIVLDGDTDELLIRTFIRNDGLWKQPRMIGSALRSALEIESPRLRWALAAELRRLPADKSEQQNLPEVIEALANTPGQSVEPPRETGGDPTPDAPPGPGRAEGVDQGVEEALEEESRVHARARVTNTNTLTKASRAGAHARGTKPTLAELNDAACSGRAHRLARFYVSLCAKRPPTQMLNQLGKAIDRLIADGFEDVQIKLGITAWARKNLGVGLLAQVLQETVNTPDGPHYIDPEGIPLVPIAEIPDEYFTWDVMERECGLQASQFAEYAPREIEEGDPQVRREWYAAAGQRGQAKALEETRRRLEQRVERLGLTHLAGSR